MFPIHDKVTAINQELEATKKDNFENGKDKQIDQLLHKWHGRYIARITTTGLALLISIWGVVAEQKLQGPPCEWCL